MTTETEARPINVTVKDVSEQQVLEVAIPPDITVIELTKNLAVDLNLPTVDGNGREISYRIQRSSDQCLLGDLQRAGDCIKPNTNESLVLMPSIDAGAMV